MQYKRRWLSITDWNCWWGPKTGLWVSKYMEGYLQWLYMNSKSQTWTPRYHSLLPSRKRITCNSFKKYIDETQRGIKNCTLMHIQNLFWHYLMSGLWCYSHSEYFPPLGTHTFQSYQLFKTYLRKVYLNKWKLYKLAVRVAIKNKVIRSVYSCQVINYF